MNLSQKAKKAVAAGLALSTLMWSVSLFALPAAFAAPHADGCIVLSGGTVWLITGGQRRGFTSAEVFASHGYNFGQVQAANSEDEALPVGPIQVYADGSLVKGPNDPLVYLVSGGQKRGFVSGSVFTGLGYSFANIQWAPVNTFQDLPTGSNVESATERHAAGTWVNASGTIWKMTATGRMGVPSMEVFNSYGMSFAKVVAANAADLAATNEGVLTARSTCGSTGAPGAVNVTAAGPASSTLIVDTTDGGNNLSQAVAPLANYTFTGNGTVTSVTLQRTGVSTDQMLANVYLFDGGTRITDAGAFSSNFVTFTNASGLFSVSGSKTITVKADLDDGSYAGQTVGVNLTAATLSSGSVGGLTVVGPVHSVAGASLATVAVGAPVDDGDSAAGPDIRVWESTLTVGVRNVSFSRLSIRQIGNITSSDVKNFRLFVDGTQVASAMSIDANGYVTFSGFNKLLTTGNPIVKVIADVTGGASRTAQFSLRNKSDIEVMDSQYNVNVSATGTFPASGDGVLITNGTVTVVRATDSPSGNVTNNLSNAKLAKWTITAYGEPIKIENLAVAIDTSGTDGDYDLRNGKLHVNGAQVGSTASLVAAGAATAAATFNTNFTVTPGTPATVELFSDIYDEDATGAELVAGDTITAYLIDNDTSNGTRQVSLGTLDVPTGADVVANQLTVASGSLTAVALASYPSQTVVVPQSAFKIGQWTVNGNTSEAVNVNTFEVDFTGANSFDASDDLTNVYLKIGDATSSIKGTVSDSDNTWSNSVQVPVNGSLNVELWATIGSSVTAGATHTMQAALTVTGTTAQSSQTVYADDDTGDTAKNNGVAGQTITSGSGAVTESLDSSAALAMNTDDNKTISGAAAFKFTAANDSFVIDEVQVLVNAATTVTSVVLKDGGTTLATKTGAATVNFGGLNVSIPANTTKVLTVDLVLGSVGTGAGTSGEDVKVTLDHYYHRNSSGVRVQDTTDVPGNSIFVYAATPTITEAAIPNVDPVGTVDIAKWTVTANGGTVAVKQFGVSVVTTEAGVGDATLTAGTFKLFRDGVDITDQVGIVNASGATIESTNTLGEGTAAAYILFSTEETISSSRTYTLRTTLGGAWATGDSIRVDFNSDSSVANTISYLDGVAGTTAAVAELATSAGGSDTGAQNFIWSDVSAIPHTTTVADDTTPTSSGDWNNGYLVKNLPLPAQTLTY